jgi:hypothetical protein
MTDQPKKKREPVPDEITIQLSKPIVLKSNGEEEHVTEINLKEPTLGQLTAFIKKTNKESALDCMVWLVSEISGIPQLALKEIGTRDYYKAQEYLSAFLTPPDEDDPEGN